MKPLPAGRRRCAGCHRLIDLDQLYAVAGSSPRIHVCFDRQCRTALYARLTTFELVRASTLPPEPVG